MDGVADESSKNDNLQNGWDGNTKSDAEDSSCIVPGIITPRSTPSPAPSSSKSEEPPRKKMRTWDPEESYEIEKIVGYHIEDDDLNKMTYFVKWNGWSSKYNTYEPIENMTGCNLMLCEYFEVQKPSKREREKMNKEVEDGLKTYEIYDKLKENSYNKMILDEFSEDHLDISGIFGQSLQRFKEETEKQYDLVIRTLIGMYSHRDPGMFRRAMNYKICLLLCKIREEQLDKLKELEKKINQLESCRIVVENNVDFDIFPNDFNYDVKPSLGENVVMPLDPPIGCECKGGCNLKSQCCGPAANSFFAYNVHGKLRIPEHSAIYECNSKCTCSNNCVNRVVQRGRKVGLGIFKTEKCGWGVRALEKISKGTFVCEYIGEIIRDSVAVVRDIDYVRRNISYLFDLDFNESDDQSDMYCIDATDVGNVARFINHSCEPNLNVFPVWIDCLDPNLPRLAFFAKKNIQKDEEIHFDYENIQEEVEISNEKTTRMITRIRCQCGSSKCREWVFGNK